MLCLPCAICLSVHLLVQNYWSRNLAAWRKLIWVCQNRMLHLTLVSNMHYKRQSALPSLPVYSPQMQWIIFIFNSLALGAVFLDLWPKLQLYSPRVSQTEWKDGSVEIDMLMVWCMTMVKYRYNTSVKGNRNILWKETEILFPLWRIY